MDTQTQYIAKRQLVVQQLQQINALKVDGVNLAKPNSNLFRARKGTGAAKLDVRSLNRVINVDVDNLVAEVEGMTTYEDLVDVTLKYGLVPTVVPQLATITIGGAVSGGGIEASSFKYGLVHETITEMEVLLSDGQVVTATPSNDYADLFFSMPNSFGTLGYILKLKVKLVAARPFVRLQHRHFSGAREFFAAIKEVSNAGTYQGESVDFMDGMIQGEGRFYLTLAQFTDAAPKVSNYTYRRIYYRSITERSEDYLTARDYIWRWDPDWFWCSNNFGLQNPLIRLLLGKWLLNSKAYWGIVGLDRKYNLSTKFGKLTGHTEPRETVIQDVQIPLKNAAEFWEFFASEVSISPVWICPTKAYNPKNRFPLYPLDSLQTYVNFGFWDSVKTRPELPPNHFNRLIEQTVSHLGGEKGLYSDSFYSPQEFWSIYDKPQYQAVKSKYDPDGRFKDLYAKCVQAA